MSPTEYILIPINIAKQSNQAKKNCFNIDQYIHVKYEEDDGVTQGAYRDKYQTKEVDTKNPIQCW